MLRNMLLGEGFFGSPMYSPVVEGAAAVVDPKLVVDPAAAVVDPKAAVVDPKAAVVDPKAAVVDPAAAVVDPKAVVDAGAEWRKRMAGDDEKLLGEAGRYNSDKDILKALVEAKGKLRERATAVVAPLAADATPEQIKAWRAENGIPDDWKGYKVEGLDKLPDAQRQLYETFLEGAHGKNLPPAAVKEAIGVYRAMEEKAMDAMVTKDIADQEKAIEVLTDEWGGRVEFKRNTAMANNFLEAELGPEAKSLMGGRLADGSLVGSNPKVINWVVALARNAGFADGYVPGDQGSGPGVSIDDRVAAIKTAMALDKSDPKSYWNDPKMQDEYTRLTAAKLKSAKK